MEKKVERLSFVMICSLLLLIVPVVLKSFAKDTTSTSTTSEASTFTVDHETLASIYVIENISGWSL